eukprot:TRINITY_DN9312_c3_g1_i2.p1 TRINITY_DN9312_c3_g1~~TRINITY_DN9312_c3_g1_i2.p1  ORF type:complete len:216 (+),score=29.18 TRINITY_DN9312_c3_g1_i2:65-649(+)
MDIFNGVRAHKMMCAYALHTLDAHLNNCGTKYPAAIEGVPHDADVNGLFVTYEKNDRLRGCIGRFSQINLHEGLGKMAITAAMQDTRFSPMRKDELSSLTCSVTILSKMTPIDRWDDWEIGRHGIYMDYREGGRSYSATFLPSVIPEQGWTKKQTFEHLLAKSGSNARATPEVLSKCTVHTYEAGSLRGDFQIM